MGKIKTILWDVDGTLIDFKGSENLALRRCFEQAGVSITAEQLEIYRQINASYWKKLELGEITKQRVLCGRFEDFFAAVHIKGIDASQFNAAYQKALGETAIPNDGALEVCAALYGKLPQYVVSNGTAIAQKGKLAISGLGNYMDKLFISEEIGCEKPDLRFFERSFAQIPDFQKESTIIVGDSLSSDIRGANNAGILCCWYNPENLPAPKDLRIDYTVGSLLEIPALL